MLDDANIKTAVETGAQARQLNSGQSCIAATRFVVHANQLVRSDPQPLLTLSGYSRKLSGTGIREFVNRKMVWVE